MNHVDLTAHAKINLSLAVRFRRADGFHEIESVFQEIEFGDRLSLHQTTDLIFQTDSAPLQVEADNLCLRAAKLMKQEYRIPGVRITLNKKIPLAAGLGGGSSDAAAVLRGISTLYDLKLSDERLRALAAGLGSDVPFFVGGGSALVRGRGEIIEAIDLDTDYFILLLHPQVSINTAWAYANLKMGLTKDIIKHKFIGFEFQNLSLENFRDNFANDFEQSIFAAYPQLAESKQILYRSGADFACMSGSGATIYALFRDEKLVKAVHQELKARFSCTLTRPVARRIKG
jgi:4-diphosphocytidyl-2-C-methyl-D-erythritol kinase